MIKVKRLSSSAIIPTKAHETDAGFDLYSNENKIILPKGRATIKTGISLALPELPYPIFQLYLRIAPRSGLATKSGIDVLAGVIDFNYRGEIIVCILNTSDEPFEINRGDKIAQIIPEIILKDELVEVDELEDTDRGSKRFGSSGY